MKSRTKKLMLKLDPAKMQGDGKRMLEVDYKSTESFLDMAVEDYAKKREEYFDRFADDPDLMKVSRVWEKSARKLMGWLESWFAIHGMDPEEQKDALDLMDRVTKDSWTNWKMTTTARISSCAPV